METYVRLRNKQKAKIYMSVRRWQVENMCNVQFLFRKFSNVNIVLKNLHHSPCLQTCCSSAFFILDITLTNYSSLLYWCSRSSDRILIRFYNVSYKESECKRTKLKSGFYTPISCSSYSLEFILAMNHEIVCCTLM